MPRPIGGDFETVSSELLGDSPVLPPWERRHGTGIAYLESGRQALAAVEGALREEGRHRLLIPAFFCDSMVVPFVRRGWEVVAVPIGRDLFPLPSSITAALTRPYDSAVLHAPYFGQDTPPLLSDELAAARQAGARVVVDETHRPFAASGRDADFSVASLRKTLPLLDGAYVAGLGPAVGDDAAVRSGQVAGLRAEAMTAKRHHLAGERGPDRHLALFREADGLAADRLAAQKISEPSHDVLRHLDYAEIIRRRSANAAQLATALSELGVTLLADPGTTAEPPSHVVIRAPKPRALQAALAAQGIYCPIHWPPPASLAVPRWPDRLLSIPVDQRYDANDMGRIAQAIGELSSTLYRLSVTEKF